MADGKETKPDQDQDDRKIPVFTVLKNGAILKNIFIVNNVSSFEKDEFLYREDEDVIVIGRHPDCNIMLTHPSISRFHLQIHSIPFSQKIFVVDLSSVHGTWVSEKKIEPGARVEMREGDTLRVGGSSRFYKLHWVPLSRAYDFETPPLSALGVFVTEMKEDEDAIVEEKVTDNCEKDNSLLDESKENQLQEEESIFDSIDPPCFNENWNVDMIKEIPSAPPLDEAEGVDMSLFDGDDIESPSRNEIEQEEISRLRTMPFGNESRNFSMVDFLSSALVNEKKEFDDEIESPLPLSLPLSAENFSFNVEDVIMSSFFGGESQSPSRNKIEQMETSRFGTINFSMVDDGMPVSAVDSENESPQPHSSSLSEENLSFNVEDVIMSSFIVGESKSQLTHKFEQMETSRLMTINLSMVDEEGPASVNRKQQYDIENECPQSHSLPLSSENVSLNVEDIVMSSFFGGESKSPARNKFEQMEPSNIRTVPIENESTSLSMVHDANCAPENGNQQYDNVDKSPQPHFMPLSEENLSINAENISIFSFHGGKCERPLRNKLEQKEVSSPSTIPFRNESNNVAMVNDGKSISENGSQQLGNDNEKPHSMPIAAETLSLNVGVLAETHYQLVHKQESSIKPLLPFQSKSTTEKKEFVVKKTLHPLEGDHSSITTEERKLEMGILDKSQTTGSISKKDFEHREFSNLSVPCMMDFVCSSMKNDEVSSEIAAMKERHTPQSFSSSAEICETQMLGTSPVMAQNTSATLTIWSRRGKQASFPLVKTGVSGGNRVKSSLKDELNHKMTGDEIDSNTHPSHWDGEEEEIFTPDKENFTPNTLLMKSLKKKGKIEESSHSKSCNSQSSIIKSSSKFNQENESSHGSDKENQTPKALQERKLARHISKNIMRLKKEKTVLKRGADRAPFQSLQLNSAGKSAVINSGTKSNLSVNCTGAIEKNKFTREGKKHYWTMVVDIASLLNKESMKSLQLLQGLKGTHLIIPRTVIRELDCLRRHGSLFRRTTEASSVLQWIEDCMVKTRWWIHVQSSVEEGGLIAPTPRATTQSQYTEGEGLFCRTAGSNCGSFMELLSPTTEDHILDSALRFRKLNDGQLVILSDDVTMKIKAMAEGLICETTKEFRESLVNPFSERFLWADSSPRGLTWSCSDDVVLRERYNNNHCSLRSSKGEGAKGLKLILLHNSHYGRLG